MRLFLILIALLMSMTTRADVLTAYETPAGAIAPIQKDAAVWVKCIGCNVIKDKLIQELQANGYKVVTNASDAAVRIVFAAGVSVPSDGKAPRLFADDAYGKGIPPIPPAVKSANGVIEPQPSSPQRDILQLDSSVIQVGTMTTSSRSGAIGFAVGVNAFLSMIERSMADAIRTPGVAELSVTIADGGNQRRGFRVLAAANTQETPDALLDGAIAKAIEGLVNGVQETKAAKEVGNAR
jgi:hypothetical protein